MMNFFNDKVADALNHVANVDFVSILSRESRAVYKIN